MRLAEVERNRCVSFRWRPFSVRQIMIEIDNIPLKGGLYVARHRAAGSDGWTADPRPDPLVQHDVANRVAVVGAAEGWVADCTRATYRRWFEQGLEPGSEPNLSDSLREIGQEPRRVIERAASAEIGEAYEAATDEARKLGIFGSPTFAIGRELFWGDDRLDDAIAWYRRHSLAR